jgi:hypothetical protein
MRPQTSKSTSLINVIVTPPLYYIFSPLGPPP